MPITDEQIHRPEHCALCGASLTSVVEEHAYTGHYEIDVAQPGNGMPGLVVVHTKHTYMECECVCGHKTRAVPGRASPEGDWKVELTEWHLVGPMLVALICALSCC